MQPAGPQQACAPPSNGAANGPLPQTLVHHGQHAGIQAAPSPLVEPRSAVETSVTDQLRAALIKNYQIKLNNKCSCCVETFLPCLFILGLIGVWSATSDTTVATANFVPDTATINVTTIQAAAPILCMNYSDPAVTSSLPFPPCNMSRAVGPKCMAANPDLPIRGLCMYGFPPFVAVGLVWATLAQPNYIPSLDEMILFRWLQQGFSNSPGANLYFYPDTSQVRSLVTYMNTTSILFKYAFGKVFPDEASAISFRDANGNGRLNWAHINVPSPLSATNMQVFIRMNRTAVPDTTTTNAISRRFGIGDEPSAQYMTSGFLSLQQVIYDFYATQVIGRPPLVGDTRSVMTPMPVPSYISRYFVRIASVLAPLALVFAFLYGVSQLCKSLVEEKETRTREAMLIMGLSTQVFYASWIITYLLQYLITGIVSAILLKVICKAANGAIIFAVMYLFMLSTIGLSTLISSVLSRARVASIIAPIVFFIIGVPSFTILGQAVYVVAPLCLLSPTALGVGLQLIFTKEESIGVQPDNMWDAYDKVNMGSVLLFLAGDTVLYFLIAFYLDAVFPGDWGSRRHPLFFILEPLHWLRSKKRESGQSSWESEMEQCSDGRDPTGVYEDENDRHGIRPSVRLRGLRRTFGSLVAVNDLTLDMYEGDVTVLLGHNGAGKTTAINVITGMLEPTLGDCFIYDRSCVHELNTVRQSIGFCPQHNILFNGLTCRQHLEFFARIKGLHGDAMDKAVNAMLQAVDLTEKADGYSDTLSGGQKRKLSVAIAFVGGNRMVFLDEPTAGMDVGARRHTWDLLKVMSAGRTILLTTHYMDEADLLGQRVAIMSSGSLKCMGSPMYLKSRLGVGYTLTLAHAATDEQHRAMTDLVKSVVESAEEVTHAHGEAVYRLPIAATSTFAALLSQLEQRQADFAIRSIGMSMTTLEEVFLKLANDETMHAAEAAALRNAAAGGDRAGLVNGAHTPTEAITGEKMDPASVKPRPDEIDITFMGQLTALFMKRLSYIRRDYRTIIFQIFIPIVGILVGIGLGSIRAVDPPGVLYGENYYGAPSLVDVSSNVDPGFLTALSPSLWTTNVVPNATARAVSNDLLNTFNAHYGTNRIWSVAPNQSNLVPFPASVLFFNDSITHAAPIGFEAYRHAQYLAQGMPASVAGPQFGSYPYELTSIESQQLDSIRTFLLAIFIMIPFTFVPSTFVSFVVREREIKAKHLQIISGMNIVTYWISNLIFDFCCFLVTMFFTFMVFLIFNRKEYIGTGDNFGATFLLFLFFGLSTITSAYMYSFAFDNHSTAQTMSMMGNFIAGFLLVLTIFILEIIPSTQSGAKIAVYFCRIIPAYCLGEGLNNMAIQSLIAAFTGGQTSPWQMDTVGWDLVYCALAGPIYFCITLILDHPARRMRTEQLLHNPDLAPPPVPNEDVDVESERQRVDSGNTEGDVVVVRNLSKQYGDKVAVKNLTFGVHAGEIFGFLGTNGAGKTTTIAILCGEQLPNTGRGWVNHFDVVAEPSASRAQIGYCPQFDATIDLLTPNEHLKLFSGLRGLNAEATTRSIEYLLSFCDLTAHRDKLAADLSGGNRRKLSVAIALLGAPTVVFLDEPSAGMDPMARRALWTTITEVSKRSSIVLTTHHLEEVEAMGHRVAIMDRGILRCIGSMQHLKSRFGVGFELTVRFLDTRAIGHFFEDLGRAIAGAVVIEQRQNKVTFGLPQSSALSTVFNFCEQTKQFFTITDYGVTQTSLEQVFLRISAEGEEGAL